MMVYHAQNIAEVMDGTTLETIAVSGQKCSSLEPSVRPYFAGDNEEYKGTVPESLTAENTMRKVHFESVDLEDGDDEEGDDEDDDDERIENKQKKKRLKKKKPKHILIEDDSSSDEDKKCSDPGKVNPSDMTWILWMWYYVTAVSSGALRVAEFLGEKLAAFFGITTPKYQYVIDEYYRLKELEREEEEKEQKERELIGQRNLVKLERLEDGGQSFQLNQQLPQDTHQI